MQVPLGGHIPVGGLAGGAHSRWVHLQWVGLQFPVGGLAVGGGRLSVNTHNFIPSWKGKRLGRHFLYPLLERKKG